VSAVETPFNAGLIRQLSAAYGKKLPTTNRPFGSKGGAIVKRFFALIVNFYLLTLPTLLWAAEGLDVPEAMEKKVPLTGLSGMNLFFAKSYNDNLWTYAIYCTVLMGVVGMAIALVTDVILKSIGMEVHKIEHKE
jgi:ABC-type phosphate/phosphonate transport system permease subunit